METPPPAPPTPPHPKFPSGKAESADQMPKVFFLFPSFTIKEMVVQQRSGQTV